MDREGKRQRRSGVCRAFRHGTRCAGAQRGPPRDRSRRPARSAHIQVVHRCASRSQHSSPTLSFYIRASTGSPTDSGAVDPLSGRCSEFGTGERYGHPPPCLLQAPGNPRIPTSSRTDHPCDNNARDLPSHCACAASQGPLRRCFRHRWAQLDRPRRSSATGVPHRHWYAYTDASMHTLVLCR